MHKRSKTWLAIIGLLVLTACTKDKGPIYIESSEEVVISYANDVQPIFDASCNGPGCHDLFEQAGLLNLDLGVSYDEIVNVPSFFSNPQILVVPFDSENSVLLQKMNGNPEYSPQMPLFAPALAEGKIQIIESWIDQGALNN
jgi:predicted small lipoprotein YifL